MPSARVHFRSPTPPSQRAKRPLSSLSGESDGESEPSIHSASDVGAYAAEIPSLALTSYKGTMGCAYLDVEAHSLLLLEDGPESGLEAGLLRKERDQQFFFDADSEISSLAAPPNGSEDLATLRETVIEQLKPELVLLDSKCPESLTDRLKDTLTGLGATVQIRPSREFAVGGNQRLLDLDLPMFSQSGYVDLEHVPGSNRSSSHAASRSLRGLLRSHTDTTAKELQLGSAVDLSSMHLSSACANALLQHLARIQAIGETNSAHPPEAPDLPFTSIRTISLEKCLNLSADSRAALGIFDKEAHSSVHSSRQQEGLSLFGLLSQSCNHFARSLMRRWFHFPSTDLKLLSARHDAVECFLILANSESIGVLSKLLAKFVHIPKLLTQLKLGSGSPSTWKGLAQFCVRALEIREAVRTLRNARDVDIVQRVMQIIDRQLLRPVPSQINQVIDWDVSAAERRVCVKAGYDRELDNLQSQYDNLPATLDSIAKELSSEVDPAYAESIFIVYFPQLGYLLATPLTDDTEQNEPQMEGWEYQFATATATYWKSDKMVDIDRHIGDLHTYITEREIEIVSELTLSILQMSSLFVNIAEVCAELNCLLSFANAAKTYGYIRPEMTSADNVIEVGGCRHPLQELCVESFIPNDIHLEGGRGVGAFADPSVLADKAEDDSESISENAHEPKSVMILTGANGCGKSTLLKSVALCVFMAQIGSFVPAERARLSVCDCILTRVQARESIGRLQSSFMVDLGQISHALRTCTSRSLILIDEFGKGTEATDGAAIFAATIQHLLERGSRCPKVLCASHFHNIFEHQLLPHLSYTTLAHLEIILSDDDAREDQELFFLYRVRPGLSSTSHASVCALRQGVPQWIVDRAQHATRLYRRGELNKLSLELADDNGEEDGVGVALVSRKDVEEAEEAVRRLVEWEGIEEDDFYVDDGFDEDSTAEQRPTMRALQELLLGQ